MITGDTGTHDELLQVIDQGASRVIDLARDLVAMPSENHPPCGGEFECQHYLARRLRDDGLTVDVFEPTEVAGITEHPAYLPGRDYRGRPNVVGTWRGTGGGRSLILSGHIDVVPVIDEPSATHQPYDAALEDDRLYGRGAWDMKGGLAAALAAVEILKEAGIRPGGDVLFESVVDEEFGGANGTLACRLRGYTADAAIIPECGTMAIWVSTRCGQTIKFTVTNDVAGRGFLSTLEENPIWAMARVMEGLSDFKAFYEATHPQHPLYLGVRDKLMIEAVHLKAGDPRPDGVYMVPHECWLRAWFETYPDVDGDHFLNEELRPFLMARAVSDPVLRHAQLDITREGRLLEGSEVPADHPIVQSLRAAATQVLGSAPAVEGGIIACDAPIFTKHGGIPAILMGPSGRGAHGPDEYVSVQDLISLTKVFALTIVQWCGLG